MKPRYESWTGERLETFITGETMFEHLHRYAIALSLAEGQKVLDIACGEGYGAALLSKKASSVTGIDISSKAIETARKKYKNSNLRFETGDILNIPSEDASFTMITCFETIEHVEDHHKLLKELRRVLTSDGILLLSTPEMETGNKNAKYINPFHIRELTGESFKELVLSYFPNCHFYKQNSFACSFIESDTSSSPDQWYTGNYVNINKLPPPTAKYWLAIASNGQNHENISGFFLPEQSLTELIHEESEAVRMTGSYKLGRFLTAPWRMLLSLFGH